MTATTSLNHHLRLYAHNQVVSGQGRAAVYDLHRGSIRLIPAALPALIDGLRRESLAEVSHRYFREHPTTLRRYIDFLVQEDLAFLTAHPEHYVDVPTEWHFPYRLASAVIAHRASSSPYDLAAALTEVGSLGCHSLELWLEDYPENSRSGVWTSLIRGLQDNEFQSVELFLRPKGGRKTLSGEMTGCLEQIPRLNRIVVLGAEREETHRAGRGSVSISYTSARNVREFARRPDPRRPIFVAHNYFWQAQTANPYFNRRVGIDTAGRIRNDLLHATEAFGVIGVANVRETMAQPDFQRLWSARPDDIAEVADDPLRYCLPYDRPLRYCAAEGTWKFTGGEMAEVG